MNCNPLYPLADRVRFTVLSQFPDWARYAKSVGGGDIEIAVPAPVGSQAGNLIINTQDGQDLWVRYSPPYMAYAVDDESELSTIVLQLISEQASFAVVLENETWKETTLVRPNEIPELNPGQHAQIVSWLGTYDREVS